MSDFFTRVELGKPGWRFWLWPWQIRRLATDVETWKKIAEHGVNLEKVYQRTPAIVSELEMKRSNLERLLVLAGMAEDHPLWRVVLSYADEHERNEKEAALRPDLTNEQRQYNAGRAASAYDFATGLRDLRVRAEEEAAKLKKE